VGGGGSWCVGAVFGDGVFVSVCVCVLGGGGCGCVKVVGCVGGVCESEEGDIDSGGKGAAEASCENIGGSSTTGGCIYVPYFDHCIQDVPVHPIGCQRLLAGLGGWGGDGACRLLTKGFKLHVWC
jgi:hypothetical protein